MMLYTVAILTQTVLKVGVTMAGVTLLILEVSNKYTETCFKTLQIMLILHLAMIICHILRYWLSGYRHVSHARCRDWHKRLEKHSSLSSAISACNANSNCHCILDMYGNNEHYNLHSSFYTEPSIRGTNSWVKHKHKC